MIGFLKSLLNKRHFTAIDRNVARPSVQSLKSLNHETHCRQVKFRIRVFTIQGFSGRGAGKEGGRDGRRVVARNRGGGLRRASQKAPRWLALVCALAVGAQAASPVSRPGGSATNAAGLLAGFRAGPMRGVESIVFAARGLNHTDGHWYANFGYYSHDPDRKAYGIGGRLYRLDLDSGNLTTLLADDRGGVRDPCVHYDGNSILFSYRPGGTANSQER